MERKYIKLNNSNNHLSLGNIINIIKLESKNKISAIQSECFCAIFDTYDISDSTINNYCLGARSIGSDYKQIYLNLKKKFKNNKNTFIPIVNNILSIISGNICDIKTIKDINTNLNLINLVKKLYTISKNDYYITKEYREEFKDLYNKEEYYNLLVSFLTYAILEKKQPIYEDEKIQNAVESILENTDISVIDLQNYLLLELKEGINFDYSLINLAKEDNPYANYHLGLMEYNGLIDGKKNYLNAYKYFSIASNHNHPSALWMMGNMIISGKIGNFEYKKAYEYYNKAKKLGNIAAINSLGLMYKNGLYVKKNSKKALELFKEAADNNYAYAYNNLGLIYESTNPELSKEYFEKSSNLGESFASNKLGEIYRLNNDYKKAYEYYNKALSSTIKERNIWAYYNLAKYFFLEGNIDIPISKDIDKAILYFEYSNNLIESLIELIYIYYSLNNIDKVNHYKRMIENHPSYNDLYKKVIEKELKNIKKTKELVIP